MRRFVGRCYPAAHLAEGAFVFTMAVRILSILAAVLLVGAVALALLEPVDASLSDALTGLSQRCVPALHQQLQAWMWDDVAVPMLLRPCWLLPASVGLVVAGIAISINITARPGTSRSHRWRS
jgi:hypothetical protein